MGTLNAVNFVVAAQPGRLDDVLLAVRSALGVYVGVYAVLSLYLFWQAIEALRPRQSVFTPKGGPRTQGLRFIPDLLDTPPDDYLQRWNEATVGELNREMALHAQALARVNELKFRSLSRVYVGLLTLTSLSAALFTVIAFRNIFG